LRRIEMGVYIEAGSIATKAFTDFPLSCSRFSTTPHLPGGGYFLFGNGKRTYGRKTPFRDKWPENVESRYREVLGADEFLQRRRAA